jgi:hypothetical protein
MKYKANYHQDFIGSTNSYFLKDRWIGANSIDLTIPGKPGCPIKMKKKKKLEKINIKKPSTILNLCLLFH